ncbi:MAG TPA: FAD:protein FMN transferase [Acidimicrobiales bacterium]|nr:FAD:protein FMN transferase [Acidimicrobiales bacterium]
MSTDVLHHDEPVMGTVVSIDIYPSKLSRDAEILALARARMTLHRVDAVFSTYREHSPISRLRRGEIALDEAPAEVAEVLDLCKVVREMSEGWFDPWAMPGGVDPTGLVKGWSVQRVLHELVVAGVEIASVNAGGDIATTGVPRGLDRWRFGVQDPFFTDRLVCIVKVLGAIATSGSYTRGAHLIDPRSRRAVVGVASATVVGSDLTIADGLATALAVAGPALLGAIERAGCLGFVITSEGMQHFSPDFPFADINQEAGPEPQ